MKKRQTIIFRKWYLLLTLSIVLIAFAHPASPLEIKPTQQVSLIYTVKLSNPIHRVDVSREQNLIAVSHITGKEQHIAYIFSLENGELVNRFVLPDKGADLTLSPDGKYLLAAVSRGDVGPSTIWDISSGKLAGQFDWLDWGRISPGGKILFEYDFYNFIYKFYRFPQMEPIDGIGAYCGAIAFNRDGSLLAANGCRGLSKFQQWSNRERPQKSNNLVGLWRTEDFSKLLEIKDKGGKSGSNALAFSEDSRYLVSLNKQGLDIYNTIDGSLAWTIPHKNRKAITPYHFSFSKDGAYIIAVYNTLGTFYKFISRVKVWRLSDGELVSNFKERGKENYKSAWHGLYDPGIGLYAYEIFGTRVNFWRFDETTELVQGHPVNLVTAPLVMDVSDRDQ